MLDTANEVLKTIINNGYKAYIVGGYPRDLYLNKDSVDIDMCTNATPKQLKEIFKSSILPKQEYGGVTVVFNNIRFEITTFRKEIKYENNCFPVKIKYIDYLIDDLKRRDFTINTLCLDENGEYIDLLNARKDIDCKIIKTVGNSDKKIEDDILRSLRAIRFATILDFKLDDELKKSIMKYGYLLKNLSYYRKKDELDKIFSSPNAKYGIDLIKELKLQEYLELNNIDKLVITSPIAIWAQLDVLDKYNFSSSEREIIENVNEVMNLDLFDNNTLYKYGLYVCTLVAEIKGINRKEIILKYNNLQIKAPNEVTLKGMDICNLLNKKPGPYLKKIINTLEEKIVNNELLNNKEDLSKYVLENY